MLENQTRIKLHPKIILQGGVVEIEVPFDIDPFHYEKDDFSIEKNPLKMIVLSNNRFVGEIISPLHLEKNQLFVKTKKETLTKEIYHPKVLATGFYEIESRLQKTMHGTIFFLDIKNTSHHHGKTVIYSGDSQLKTIEKWNSFKKILNSLLITESGDIFITTLTDNSLFKININNMEMEEVAQGIGQPQGLAAYKNQIFIGDKQGNLFEYNIITQKTIFLTELPVSHRGYHLTCNQQGDLFIGIPKTSGSNKIFIYRQTGELETFLETFNFLGDILFSEDNVLYWIENTRKESIIYRIKKNEKKEKMMSGSFFKSLLFSKTGDLLVNDSHTIYQIKKEWLYA